jgi:hypothetical protein
MQISSLPTNSSLQNTPRYQLGGILTIVNEKPGSINSIHSWSTAFMIFMDIMLEKWPFKTREYLKACSALD